MLLAQAVHEEPLPFEFLIYVAPEKIWRADMPKFCEAFRAAPANRDYFAFLKATDGLLHSQGPARLNVALESRARIQREIRRYCGSETEIVMFSDHGMNLEENRRVGRFVRLYATHGNALQSSSNAFLMSTHREFSRSCVLTMRRCCFGDRQSIGS